jgi:hypothetical protein
MGTGVGTTREDAEAKGFSSGLVGRSQRSVKLEMQQEHVTVARPLHFRFVTIFQLYCPYKRDKYLTLFTRRGMDPKENDKACVTSVAMEYQP